MQLFPTPRKNFLEPCMGWNFNVPNDLYIHVNSFYFQFSNDVTCIETLFKIPSPNNRFIDTSTSTCWLLTDEIHFKRFMASKSKSVHHVNVYVSLIDRHTNGHVANRFPSGAAVKWRMLRCCPKSFAWKRSKYT